MLYEEVHPGFERDMFKERLLAAIKSVQQGLTCDCCGSPIWMVGTALLGWRGCYACMEGRNSLPFLEISADIALHRANTDDACNLEQLRAAIVRLPEPNWPSLSTSPL